MILSCDLLLLDILASVIRTTFLACRTTRSLAKNSEYILSSSLPDRFYAKSPCNGALNCDRARSEAGKSVIPLFLPAC